MGSSPLPTHSIKKEVVIDPFVIYLFKLFHIENHFEIDRIEALYHLLYPSVTAGVRCSTIPSTLRVSSTLWVSLDRFASAMITAGVKSTS